MDEEYNLVSQDLDNSREIQKQLSNEIEQVTGQSQSFISVT